MKTSINLNLFLLVSSIFIINSSLASNQKDFAVSFSPDGQQIVYYSYRGNELPDLYIASVDGSNERQLTHTKETWEIMPKWSPNKSEIIFTAGPSMKDLELYSIKADGTELKQLTTGKGNATAAIWHPNGKSIIYSRFHTDEEVDIMTMELSSGKKQNLTAQQDGKFTNPTWSPDGTMIAYTLENTAQKVSHLYTADAQFKQHKQLTDDDSQPGFLSWSNDSNTLVFSANVNGQNNDLMALNIKQNKARQITDIKDAHVYFSAFSPNGQHLFMDIGNWSDNFFIYHARWNGQQLGDTRTQVSGQNWVDEIALLEESYLAPMIGKWHGITTQGSSKDRYEERVNFVWGPNKKSISVDMSLLWDGQEFGRAKGLLGLDWVKKQVHYNSVMDDGTVVMQTQTNPGEPGNWEMAVTTTGDGSRFPLSFKITYQRNDDGSWETHLYQQKQEQWELWSSRKFTLVP